MTDSPAAALNSAKVPKTVMISANDTWSLLIFREQLIRNLVGQGHEVIAVSGDSQYADQLRALGCSYHEIPFEPRSMGIGNSLKSAWALVRLIRAHKPEALLTFNPKASVVAAFANLVPLTRHISTVSGFGVVKTGFASGNLLKRLVGRMVGYLLVKAPTVAVVQNAEDFETVRTLRGEKRPTWRVHGSGVDLARFTPQVRSWAPLRVLFAARFLKAKGILDYITVARALAGPDFRFALGGLPVQGEDGLSEDEVREAIAGSEIAYLGKIEDMAAQLAQTDICVLPSQYGEGIPRVLLESAASGVVMVAYDNDGVREIVREDETGRLLPPGDVPALQAALAAMPGETARLESWSQGGRALAQEKFSETAVISLYNDLIDERRPV